LSLPEESLKQLFVGKTGNRAVALNRRGECVAIRAFPADNSAVEIV
jgi:hypothetical protein